MIAESPTLSVTVDHFEAPDGEAPFVPQPTTIEETGLELSMLVDLALKAIYFYGRPSGRVLSDQLCLSFPVMTELITFLRREQVVEVVGSAAASRRINTR
jgi:hypothetical protein